MLLKLSATVSLAYKSRWDRLRTFRLSIRSYALALLFCNRRKKTFGGQLLSEFSGIRTRDTCRPVKESRLVPLKRDAKETGEKKVTAREILGARRTLSRALRPQNFAILGVQFRLYDVVAPLSFLRSVSLASLFWSTMAPRYNEDPVITNNVFYIGRFFQVKRGTLFV